MRIKSCIIICLSACLISFHAAAAETATASYRKTKPGGGKLPFHSFLVQADNSWIPLEEDEGADFFCFDFAIGDYISPTPPFKGNTLLRFLNLQKEFQDSATTTYRPKDGDIAFFGSKHAMRVFWLTNEKNEKVLWVGQKLGLNLVYLSPISAAAEHYQFDESEITFADVSEERRKNSELNEILRTALKQIKIP